MFNKILPAYISAWKKTVLSLSHSSHRSNQEPGLTAFAQIKDIARKEKGKMCYLWEVFNEFRDELNPRLLSTKPNVLAYLLGFHVPNALRLMACLQRVEQRWSLKPLLKDYKGLNVWDFGCGSGAFSQLVLAEFGPFFEEKRVYLYDTNSLLLNVAKEFHEHLQTQIPALQNLKTYARKVSLSELNTSPHVDDQTLTIANLGYVWNELSKNPRAKSKVYSFFKHLVKENTPALIFILDPAHSQASRVMMETRNDLVEMGLKTIYPCPHDQPCPMLARSKDWCYSEFSLSGIPHETAYMDQLLGIKRTIFASSAYVFATPAAHSKLVANQEHSAVVVGRPHKVEEKGFTYLLCEEKGELGEANSKGGQEILRGNFLTTK
jgi:ribosomal protein RSM22 (predicted rRNA methylase)